MSFLVNIVNKMAEESLRDRALANNRSVEDQRKVDEEEQKIASRAAEEQQLQAMAERKRQRAEKTAVRKHLGSQLDLDAPVYVGHIINLSGLSSRSSGNGLKSNTVFHLVLDGPIKEGKLKREPGDLLCRRIQTGSMGVSGHGWDSIPAEHDLSKVNCPRCLQMMKRRWKQA